MTRRRKTKKQNGLEQSGRSETRQPRNLIRAEASAKEAGRERKEALGPKPKTSREEGKTPNPESSTSRPKLARWRIQQVRDRVQDFLLDLGRQHWIWIYEDEGCTEPVAWVTCCAALDRDLAETLDEPSLKSPDKMGEQSEFEFPSQLEANQVRRRRRPIEPASQWFPLH